MMREMVVGMAGGVALICMVGATRIAPDLSWGPVSLQIGAMLWALAGVCAGVMLAVSCWPGCRTPE